MKTRDERIAQRERLRTKRRYYWGQDLFFEKNSCTKMIIDTPTPCSCWMCGNPRKYFGEKTLQEKSFDEINKLSELD